jgi:hypothetical protein
MVTSSENFNSQHNLIISSKNADQGYWKIYGHNCCHGVDVVGVRATKKLKLRA